MDPTAEFTVERATAQDADTVAPLFDAYRVFYQQSSDLDGARAFIVERLRGGESVIFLARRQRSGIGFVQLYPSFSSTTMERLWILNDLYVDPAARKLGVGRLLLQRAERHARETAARGLTLSTAVDNIRAQALYERCGYVRDEVFYVYNREFEERSPGY